MGQDLDSAYRPPEHLRASVRAVSERLITVMRETAVKLGWALTVHGSMERDLDVVGIPWTYDAADELIFVERMRLAIALELRGKCNRSPKATLKPNGRKAYTLCAISDQLIESEAGAHPFVDLSVMDNRTMVPTWSKVDD